MKQALFLISLISLFTLSLFSPTKTFAGSAVLNELLPNPSSGYDWIELYNPTTSTVDLSNWILADTTSTMKTLSGTISANSFVIFEVTNRLNNQGDTIYLKDSAGATVDQYNYSSDPGVDKSYGRAPDGGDWTILSSTSKGYSNPSSTIPSPTITPSPSPIISSSMPSPSAPQPTVTQSPTSTITTSSIPSTTQADKQFEVQVKIQNFSPNTRYFLKGAFKNVGGTNYFGQTLVSGIWVKNYESYNKHLSLTTDSSGNWSGVLSAKGDLEDSGFIGAGDYIFKVGYYKEGASSVAWSNESMIHLVSSVQVPTLAISQTAPKEIKPKTEKQTTKIDLPNSLLGTKSSQFKAEIVSDSPSPKHNVYTAGFSISYLFIVGGVLIIILSIVLAYTILKRYYGNI